MASQPARYRCCSLFRCGRAFVMPWSLIWGQWLRDKLVRLRQWWATDTKLSSLISGSIESERRCRSGKRRTWDIQVYSKSKFVCDSTQTRLSVFCTDLCNAGVGEFRTGRQIQFLKAPEGQQWCSFLFPKGPKILICNQTRLLLKGHAGRLEKSHVSKRPSKAWAFFLLNIYEWNILMCYNYIYKKSTLHNIVVNGKRTLLFLFSTLYINQYFNHEKMTRFIFK